MKLSDYFTLGDAKTVIFSPSKLALGILVGQLMAYASGQEIIDWQTTYILMGVCYLNGLIRYLDALGTEDQH